MRSINIRYFVFVFRIDTEILQIYFSPILLVSESLFMTLLTINYETRGSIVVVAMNAVYQISQIIVFFNASSLLAVRWLR